MKEAVMLVVIRDEGKRGTLVIVRPLHGPLMSYRALTETQLKLFLWQAIIGAIKAP